MCPREQTPLMAGKGHVSSQLSLEDDEALRPALRSPVHALSTAVCCQRWPAPAAITLMVLCLGVLWRAAVALHGRLGPVLEPSGPYRLVERQVGASFFSFYDFYDGPDSLGSAGYNTYVSMDRARRRGLIQIDDETNEIVLQSAPTADGPRESIRLEGKRRFDRGLFILDVAHVPTGCGVWPAFWLTDEDHWPRHGEIDILEGVNGADTARTALHSSESCSMYAHVPTWAQTGIYDRATGIPNTYTGAADAATSVPADNCWVMAPHQWQNQGCVVADARNGTLGAGLNRGGGGVFALEWDPAGGYIKSWVWPRTGGGGGDDAAALPPNLRDALASAAGDDDARGRRGAPDPATWNLPYAYFAIGDGSGCAADHFRNHHIIFNLAFCGTVAGNRFQMDCPLESNWTQLEDPVKACNAYVKSEPKALDEAYWRIRGVYVYERAIQAVAPGTRANRTGGQQ